MNAPNVRSVTVRLNAAVAKYKADMRSAGKETEDAFRRAQAEVKTLNTELDKTDRRMRSLSTETRLTTPSMRAMRREVDGVSTSLRRGSHEIDRYSGRLRLIADILAIFGPSLVPIGAVAIPAVVGLTAQLGAAVGGVGSLIVAFQGVGDALEAVNEAALEPTAENLEAARVAMDNISPSAQRFVTRFQELRPVLRDIRDSTAAGWFPGLTDSLDDIERHAPALERIFGALGATGGGLAAEAAGSRQLEDFIDYIGREGPPTFEALARTVGNFADGLASMLEAFTPLNRDFNDWLLDQSRDFARWADELDRTEGFREFVDYIRENGPKVAESMGALGTSLVEVTEALAPLGGPSLKIIETFADGVSAIADSDLGTPILAGVAALAAYNRTLAVTTALQGKVAASGGLAFLGGGLAGGARGGGVRTLTRDVATLGSTWATAGARSAREMERMNAAAGRTRQTLSRFGKPTAALGGLALATSDAADGFVLSNTASLALIGTMAGPWGAAIGAGVGGALDLKNAVDATTASLRQADQAMGTGNLEAMRESLRGLNREIANLRAVGAQEEVVSTPFQQTRAGESSSITERNRSQDLNQRLEKTAELQAKIAAVRRSHRQSLLRHNEATAEASLRQAGFNTALRRTTREAGLSATEVYRLRDATRSQANEAANAYSNHTQWLQALRSAREQAKETSAGLEGNSEAVIRNRQAVEGMIGVINAQVEAGELSTREWREQRDALVDTARQMGATKGQVRELKEQLDRPLEIIVKTNAKEVTDEADGELQRFRNRVAANPITQRVNVLVSGTQRIEAARDAARAQGAVPQADGGEVPGPRHPYGDKTLILAAPGEEIITNRNGEADRYRRDRALGLIPKYADGGTVATRSYGIRGYAGGGMVESAATIAAQGYSTKQLLAADIGLRKLNKALRLSEKALDEERRQRLDLRASMRDLSSTVSSRLQSDLFSKDGRDPWTSAFASGSYGDVVGTLRGDIREGRKFEKALQALEDKGLDGPALEALLAEGDPAQFAKRSAAELAEYERLFNLRERVTVRAGRSSAEAVYGEELKAQTRELRDVKQEVRQLRKAMREEEKKNRQAQRRGASGAARNRRKD